MTKPDLTIRPDEIEWRVGATFDGNGAKWGTLLGYIDARLAMEKLDLLDEKWSSRMEPVQLNGDAGVRCTLTVNGVSREDVGTASTTEPLKGAFSDALKRAAVHFGIGRELYDLPHIAVECNVGQNGKVKSPKALPSWDGKRWTIDRNVGFVRYDNEPNQQPARGPSRPADGGTGGTDSPQRPPAPPSPEYEESPFANDPVDPTLDAILAVTGGEVVDDGVQERIDRARAKGAAQAPSGGDVCPEHGAAKVKQNRRGLYCATKVNGEWCQWTSKAAA